MPATAVYLLEQISSKHLGMSNQFQRTTWIHFKLSEPIAVVRLAELAEQQIVKSGFNGEGLWGGASQTGESLSGHSVRELFPSDGTNVSNVGTRFTNNDDLSLYFRIGEPNTPPFAAEDSWDSFTLRVNCRMDRNRLREIAETVSGSDELEAGLKNPKVAYHLAKTLFDAVGAEKCIGIDDKNLTGEYFADPPGFYFSRTEPWILSELLEDD